MTAGAVFGPYRLVKALGEVPFGTAFQAIDSRTETPVVVKRVPISPAGLPGGVDTAPLVEEARRLTRIVRPGIPNVYEVREQNGELVLVFDRLSGQTLASLLESGEGVDRSSLVTWGCELLFLLAEAHSHGVLHRHLGEHAVVITEQGRLALRDFGLTLLEADPSIPEAPEVGLGAPASIASDLHAVGVLLGRLAAAGLRPLLGRPEDDPVAAVLARATALDPARRFHDAAEMEEALRQAGAVPVHRPAEAEPVRKEPISRVVRGASARPTGSKLGRGLAAALVLAVAAGGAFVLLRPDPSAPTASTESTAASPMAGAVPESPAGRLERARQLLVEGREPEAEGLLQELLASDELPNPVPVLESLGTLRLRAGRTEEAIDLLSRAAALQPSAQLHYKLGLALAAEGRRGQALEQLQAASELDPSSLEIRRAIENLGGTP